MVNAKMGNKQPEITRFNKKRPFTKTKMPNFHIFTNQPFFSILAFRNNSSLIATAFCKLRFMI